LSGLEELHYLLTVLTDLMACSKWNIRTVADSDLGYNSRIHIVEE
jgi:hypothetical protein